MSDNNIEKNETEHGEVGTTSSEPEKKVMPKTRDPKQTPKTGALWFFTLINLLLLIGICAAAYWAYLQWTSTQDNEQNENQTLISDISKINSELDDTQAQIQRTSTQASQQQDAIQQSVNSLVEQVLINQEVNEVLQRQISEVSGRRPADWLLAEADYLVRMAGRKLWLEDDVKTAMMMLKSADSRLEDLADPSLFPVRKLIAQDIQTLHQVNPIANESIALALSGMLPQVEKLKIAALKIPEPVTDDPSNELSEDIADWQANIAKTWNAIVDDFISVTRTEQALEPFLAQKQQWLIKEQVKYALTQAQSAVLSGNETLYKASLQQAMQQIIEYYDLSDSSVEQFLTAIQQLNSNSIEKNYPTKLDAQAALSDVIESRVENVFSNKETGEL